MKRSYHRMTSKLISKVFDHTSLNEIPLSTPHHKSAHVVSPTASFFDDMDHHTTPSSPIKRLSQRFIFPGSPSSTDDESYSFNSSDTESHDEPAEHVEVQRPSLENQPVDYFSYKAQSYYPSPKTFETDATLGADHTQRLAPPTPSGPLTGSYWSPLNTPAPPPASTDSYHSPTNTPIPASEAASSPSAIAPFAPPPSSLPWRRARDLWQPNLPSTPEGDPFPYIAYESTYARDMIATQLSAFRLIAATPTPPLVLTPPATRPSRPSRRVTAPTIGLLSPQALDSGTGTVATPTPALHDDDEITIKVYFAHTSDLVKFRCRRRDTHLSDFVLTVATRMPTGWEALYAAKDPVGWGAGVKDIERACINNRARMIKLSKDVQWRWWFKECMDGGVKRLILWAM
ncbi:hypothetical protein FRB96_007350 [Tulasnella sp. 330]|nr:hypothetical protein FRB96_007350 [Tulasnella sp. 330]KAG8876729.1 hypothetical protein FRB97_003971 [Tulasnella sp. 331]